MYWVSEECPQERTKRSRPSQVGSAGSWLMTFWKRRYASGARLMAVPGCPLPTFCTASAARTRTVSTARTSRSVHPAFFASGREISRLRPGGAFWLRLVVVAVVTRASLRGGEALGRSVDHPSVCTTRWLGSRNARRLESPGTFQADPKDDVATTPMTTDAVSVSRRDRRRTLGSYVAMTKPRIIELLLVTTVPVMFLAEGGVPSLWLVLATLVGGSLSAGAANTFNSVYDRDIDRLMHRTSSRPMVTGEVSPRNGLLFGAALTVASTVWFLVLVNVLSAVLSLVAIALYAVGYTVVLKRRTSQNIVWGGVAGCMPTLIGWSAVTGSVGW